MEDNRSDALERLLWHAGFPYSEDEVEASIAACTWIPNGKQGFLQAAIEDLISTLEQVNIELNGPIPSEIIGGRQDIPRTLAYAVSEIQRLLQVFEEECEDPQLYHLSQRARRCLDTNWNEILAGDIDQLSPWSG